MTNPARIVSVLQTETCSPSITFALMPPPQAAALAEQLRALADPTRLRMLDLLVGYGQAICVCDITAQFDQRQPTISHHLRLLREAGLIDCEKRGVWAYYWATEMGQQRLAAIKALP